MEMAAFPLCPDCGWKHLYNGFVPTSAKQRRMFEKKGASACRAPKKAASKLASPEVATIRELAQSEAGRNIYTILATPPGTEAIATGRTETRSAGSWFTDAFIQNVQKGDMTLLKLLPSISDHVTQNRRASALSTYGSLQLPTTGGMIPNTLGTDMLTWRFIE